MTIIIICLVLVWEKDIIVKFSLRALSKRKRKREFSL